MRINQTTITEYIKDKLIDICLRSDLKASRFFVILSSVFMGIMLISQHDTIQYNPSYILLINIAPSSVWGLLFLLQAVTASSSLILTFKNMYTLIFDGLLGCILWTSSTTAYVLWYFHTFPGHIFPIEIIGNIMISLMVWWCMIRCWASRHTFHQISVVELKDERCASESHCEHKRRLND